MKRFKILHRTFYNYSGPVTLGPHSLLLRPRENHEMRIESSSLKISPNAKLKWYRDMEDNSVAIASFTEKASQLSIESEIVIQQFNEVPLDFVVAPEAVNYPFEYSPDDLAVLRPYIDDVTPPGDDLFSKWVAEIWKPGEKIQTFTLLDRIDTLINKTMKYNVREEMGVQTPNETLKLGSGSCRDFANLFLSAARRLGLAARFVSGYLNAPPTPTSFGTTHAWAEVYLPGAGWKGFDPTNGEIVGKDHFAVAVARLPESVPPIAGSFTGLPGSTLQVGVWVTELA